MKCMVFFENVAYLYEFCSTTYKISGKDVAKIFENHLKIFEFVPESFAQRNDHRLLFTTLHLIFKKTRLSRFLSEQERN